MSHQFSYASALRGTKRPATNRAVSDYNNTQSNPKGPTVSKELLKYLEKHKAYKTITHSFPKSSIDHGIRVTLGHFNALMMDELKVQLKTCLPSAVSTEPKWYKGFIDIGFKSADEADKAALAIIQVQGQPLDITRTRHNEDENLYISFSKLPTDMSRNELTARLKVGLASYGKILKFEMEEDAFMPHLAMSRAIAIIAPKPDVRDNISIIPRNAFFYVGEEGDISREFKITPEDAPKICNFCDCVGHVAAACPQTVEGLDLLLNEVEDVNMGEGDISTALSYPWGEFSDYVVVDPVTQQQKKEAKKALKKKQQAEAKENKRAELEFAAKRAEEAAAALREQERIAGEIEYQRALNHVNRIREEERLAAEAERYQQQLLAKEAEEQAKEVERAAQENSQFISENSFQNFSQTPQTPENFVNEATINEAINQYENDVMQAEYSNSDSSSAQDLDNEEVSNSSINGQIPIVTETINFQSMPNPPPNWNQTPRRTNRKSMPRKFYTPQPAQIKGGKRA